MAELLSRKSMDDKNYTLSRLIEAMGQLENYQNRFAHSGTLEFVLYDLGIVMSEMAGMEQPLYDMRDLDKYPPIGFGQDKEQVNHPAHYKKGGKECIDAMVEKFGADAVIAFCKCNEFKYKWRAGNKDGTTEKTDLSKAKWYKRKAKALYEQAHCWHDDRLGIMFPGAKTEVVGLDFDTFGGFSETYKEEYERIKNEAGR